MEWLKLMEKTINLSNLTANRQPPPADNLLPTASTRSPLCLSDNDLPPSAPSRYYKKCRDFIDNDNENHYHS
ncbi:hypothetical protein ACFPPD_01670 [Cohnella suwonensis]|uniref:Uncharacterized protein n=1 Tax=Cohnella suwonensis TaxID=696072 RepID=A0ABW0LRH5_9BACL